MRRMGIVIAWLAVAACSGTGSGATGVSGVGGGTTTVPDSVSGAVGSSIALRIGQAARVTDAGIGFRFTDLREDSRCPVGAQCVQAGNAQVLVDMRSATGATTSAILNLTANAQFPSAVTFGGVTLRFESLTPVPAVNGTIARTQYVASFRLSRP